ncbi:MAG: hypothetical protein GF388_00460 [Candidatus Aegiribacteria sp.]|nr:hypothetical protein [Candidatus Aegiribacteria sp.]MBD3293904.1 hypothetical protein [Candidatus Fermentibacteria bacterium]
MPAMLMLLRIKKVIIPIPWFLLWLLLLPFALLGWLIGHTGLIADPDNRWLRAASEFWRVPLLLMSMHGLEVRVRSKEDNVLIKIY